MLDRLRPPPAETPAGSHATHSHQPLQESDEASAALNDRSTIDRVDPAVSSCLGPQTVVGSARTGPTSSSAEPVIQVEAREHDAAPFDACQQVELLEKALDARSGVDQ